MSCLDSDPWFSRGQTLGVSTTDAGAQIVGSERYFVDVAPDGTAHSNALVKCIAMRNASGGTLTPGTLVEGKAGSLLTEVGGAADANSTVAGVVDEYLAGNVQNNDIFWLVVSGPCRVSAESAVTAGDFLSVGSAGGVIGGATAPISAISLEASSNNKVRVILGAQDRTIMIVHD